LPPYACRDSGFETRLKGVYRRLREPQRGSMDLGQIARSVVIDRLMNTFPSRHFPQNIMSPIHPPDSWLTILRVAKLGPYFQRRRVSLMSPFDRPDNIGDPAHHKCCGLSSFWRRVLPETPPERQFFTITESFDSKSSPRHPCGTHASAARSIRSSHVRNPVRDFFLELASTHSGLLVVEI